MNLELSIIEKLDLQIVLKSYLKNNDESIEFFSKKDYCDRPFLAEYHIEKKERLELLLSKIDLLKNTL